MKKIYVGNLSYEVSEQDLESLFNQFGTISKLNLIKDHQTGQSKGFAFIEFDGAPQAQAALKIDGQDFQGRRIRVNMARDKDSSRSSGDRGRY